MRKFKTGATRNDAEQKPDFEGFISPLVVARFGEYMHKHRHQPDGTMRDSDNWQKGIPFNSYMKSAWRHFLAWWTNHRGYEAAEDLEESLCALIFNAQGYLHELIKNKTAERRPGKAHGKPTA